MAAIEKTQAYWYAWFPCASADTCGRPHECLVEVIRTKRDRDPTPYYWCTFDYAGGWPGADSNEWIEYVPAQPRVEPSDFLESAGDR